MTVTAVVGAQWGDEGKGKVVDYLAERADIVVRFNGGSNAGHTIKFKGQEFKFHLLPSGIVRRKVHAVVANGVAVNPDVLLREMEELRSRGFGGFRLSLSDRAHVIMPYHPLLDGLEESARGGLKVGTTGRGIGPAYSDKATRVGVRLGDLLDEPLLRKKVGLAAPAKQRLLAVYGRPDLLSEEDLVQKCLDWGNKLRPHIVDTSSLLNEAMRRKKRILLEGAQGTLLDPDHGTYPYVTSSNAVAGAASVGAGIGPRRIDHVLGVTKAYTTRVGEGPFPTELQDDTGERLRTIGGEYGTTTGRPRRCGWLDLVALHHAVDVNGLDALAVTKLDALGGLAKVKMAVAYDVEGKRVTAFPASLSRLSSARPVYREFPGWAELLPEEWTRLSSGGYRALPAPARRYLDFISARAGVPIELVSVGSSREATIDRRRAVRR